MIKNHRLCGLVLVLALLTLPAAGAWAVAGPEKTEITPDLVFIPLGFISPGILEMPAGFSGWLVYDEEEEVYYLSTPAVTGEEVLAALRENLADAASLFILYTLRIVELGTTSTWGWVFSGETGSGMPADDYRLVATPQTLQGENGFRFLVESGFLQSPGVPESRSYRGATEAWIIAVPGRPVKWRTGAIYPEDYDKTRDENYLLEITPVSIQRETGRVETNVSFLRENQEHGEKSALTTTVNSKGGKPEIIAFMHRTVDRKERGLLTAGLKEQRVFALVLSALPLKLARATEIPVIPMASLDGLKLLAPYSPQGPERKVSVEAGLVSSGSASGIELNPAVRFAVVLGETAGLEIAAKAPATYFLAVKKELWEGAGTSFEAALAGGLGPVAGPALMAGVSDKVQLSPDLSTFITWYPLVYLMDGRTGLGKSHWRAGLEWELEEAQLALGLTGNPEWSAQRLEAALRLERDLWLHIGIIAENWDSPGVFLAIGARQ
jgi:hypothetical protein